MKTARPLPVVHEQASYDCEMVLSDDLLKAGISTSTDRETPIEFKFFLTIPREERCEIEQAVINGSRGGVHAACFAAREVPFQSQHPRSACFNSVSFDEFSSLERRAFIQDVMSMCKLSFDHLSSRDCIVSIYRLDRLNVACRAVPSVQYLGYT